MIKYNYKDKTKGRNGMDNDKLATELLHVFGYVNAKEEDVIVLNSSFGYLKVEYFKQIYYFLRKNNTWTMELE